MKNKHIYKISLEDSFFKVITSSNIIQKFDNEGKYLIQWEEDEDSIYTWEYDDKEQRDNDFSVIYNYKNLV